jgi:hypothetical protein
MSILEDKEITDVPTILKVIQNSFPTLPVFMLFKNKQYPTKFVSSSNDGIVIKSLGREDKEDRILFITNGGKVLKFSFHLLGSKNGYEILKPTLLEIKPASRLKERISGGKLYITNVTNQHDIAKSLVSDSVRINSIVKNYEKKIKDKIPILEIFIHDRFDSRLKLLIDHDKPILIPDKNNPDCVVGDYIPYKDYSPLIKNTKALDRFISEITIPLKYKNLVTFGYVSAYCDRPMDENYFSILNTLVNNIKKDIFSSPVLTETREAIPLSEISEGGFSILQQNSVNFGKVFLLGGTLIFDLCAPTDEKIVSRAIVRNIRPTEHHFRIGLQFFHEYELESKNLEAFLSKHFPEVLKNKTTDSLDT